ncbi:hypothetical protein N657DRAFT_682549 [Parathielavia appendiculata]|uniref:MYND-type domain-containing protein n=1 Tax=Parathielavia appendiculata TaxID=2587402 RepID=A0AAN6TVV2_9PEZI|nr:hypothetical protein N657DRAFT_682549 [Parathielavia appendiculata]
MGSGLFATAAIDAGQEIYNLNPIFKTLDAGPGHESFCHYCSEDAQDVLGKDSKPVAQTKACTGCDVARFCSKKCRKQAWTLFHRDERRILERVPKCQLRPCWRTA